MRFRTVTNCLRFGTSDRFRSFFTTIEQEFRFAQTPCHAHTSRNNLIIIIVVIIVSTLSRTQQHYRQSRIGERLVELCFTQSRHSRPTTTSTRMQRARMIIVRWYAFATYYVWCDMSLKHDNHIIISHLQHCIRSHHHARHIDNHPLWLATMHITQIITTKDTCSIYAL